MFAENNYIVLLKLVDLLGTTKLFNILKVFSQKTDSDLHKAYQ